MKIALVIVAVVLLIGIVIVFIAIGDRNDLAREREGIDRAWADVDAALQRRAELVPSVVEAVKGYDKREQAMIKEVVDARAALAGAQTPQDKIQANSQLDTALSRLLVAVENYPPLKSDDNFLTLQDQLGETENRIAVARRKYNDAVQHYNTDIKLFPKNIAAAMFGFGPDNAYFKTEPGTRAVPRMAF